MTKIISSILKICVAGMMAISVVTSCSREKAYNVPRCSTVWNGRFVDIHNGEATVEISRDGDVQTERTKDGQTCKLKVEWLDSCRYRLTYLSCDVRSEGHLGPVIFQITGVKKESYTIEGWVEGTVTNTYTSEIFRLK
jgi:hypothetical protein